MLPRARALAWVSEVLGGSPVEDHDVLQRLWRGYGELLRLRPAGGDPVVLKRIAPPGGSGRGHERKLRSYEVERAWYEGPAERCDAACRVPRLLATHEEAGERWILLEDLDAAGFPARRRHLSDAELRACLAWLAAFHATFLGADPGPLWPRGTYWHLATRPEEWAAIPSAALREAAGPIDERLQGACHRTLVHGDAKPANFCFRPDGAAAAAVDFQYVGGGVGIQDVAYLLGGALPEDVLEREGEAWSERYLARLARELSARAPAVDAADVVEEWRSLVPWAWADFHRFLAGWAPGERDGYGAAQAQAVLAQLRSR